ncbi:MAG: DUF86 domain-containing protein [Patescibacteria group bacterium]
MTSIDVIENKIAALEKYLAILAGYQAHTQEEIVSDTDRRGACERYLYLATQTAVDLAEAMVSFKQLRKPTSLRESFAILAENGLISQSLTDKMVKMVGFRNALAHDYEAIDYAIVYDVLQNKLADIKEFKEAIAGHL